MHNRLALFSASLTTLTTLSLSLVLTLPASSTVSPSSQPHFPVAQSQPLQQQGRTLYNAGRFAEAAAIWQQATETYDPTTATPAQQLQQAQSLSYLALAHQELGQWQSAWDTLDQSLDLLLRVPSQDSSDAVHAQALNAKASLLLHLGQVEQAMETWEQAQSLYESVGDQPGSWGTQVNQAQALQIMGFYRRSYQKLENLNQQLAAIPDSEIKLIGLRSLGLAYQVAGSLQASQQVLLQSLGIAQRLGIAKELGSTLIVLGRTSRDIGDAATALQYFQQAEQVSENLAEQLQAQLNQLDIYVTYGQTAAVNTLSREIYEQLSQLSPSRNSIYATVNFAASLGQIQSKSPLAKTELVNLLASAMQGARQIQDPQAEAHTLQQLGQVYAQNEQHQDAIDFTRQALGIAREIQANDIAAQSAWQLGRLFKQEWEADRRQSPQLYAQAIAAYDEAVTALQALRGDLVAIDSDVQFSFRSSVEPVYRELVSLLLIDQPEQDHLARARELIEALQLAELDNFFREACLDAEPRQIDEIDPAATVIYPILLPDRLAVILSSSGQPLRHYTFDIPRPAVEKTLREFLAALHPISDKQHRLRLAEQIYDWLIRPAEEQQLLQNSETLVFVLDGLLRNIPIAALYDGQNYLIERYAVSLSPGLQLIAGEGLEQRESQILVGGISAAQENFSALPQVEAEIQEIAQLVTKSETLLNESFTKEALANHLANSSANVIHLATHGQFSSRQEDTFLLTWQGRLNIQELAELLQNRESRSAIELLVLSACDTAAGDDRAVLGLAGLAIRSGARSTVATLWPVKDKAAALLMTRFYQKLQQPQITKAEALRQAQIEILRETDFNNPFFWSGFVLVGSWL